MKTVAQAVVIVVLCIIVSLGSVGCSLFEPSPTDPIRGEQYDTDLTGTNGTSHLLQ